MKKVLLVTTVLFFFTIGNGQVAKIKEIPKIGSDTIWHIIDHQLKIEKIPDGDVRIHTAPGKYKLYASYRNNYVTGYYAIKSNGVKIPIDVITVRYSANIVKCFACVDFANDQKIKKTDCWDVFCPKGNTKDKNDLIKIPQ